MSDDSRPEMQAILARTAIICSPPLIYQRLNEAIQHPRTSIKDIAQIIAEDPGMSARLLKLANSPLYGSVRIDSIDRAATLIGTREIRDLVLANSVARSFPCLPDELFDLTSFWRHSLACGVYARNIAIYLREPGIERFFVSGILHDIGQLVFCTQHPQLLRSIVADSFESLTSLHQTEERTLGFDHARLAGELLKTWKIPENIAELVSYHHQPSRAPKYARDATIIHLADLISQALRYGSDAEPLVMPLDNAAFEKLELPLSALQSIFEQSTAQLQDIFCIMLED